MGREAASGWRLAVSRNEMPVLRIDQACPHAAAAAKVSIGAAPSWCDGFAGFESFNGFTLLRPPLSTIR